MLILSLSAEDAQLREAPSFDPTRRVRFVEAVGPAIDRSYRLAGLLLGNAAEAEDAVQDAMLSAWERYDSLRDAARFNAWFDRILVNGCRDRLRRRGTVRFVAMDPSVDPAAGDPFRVVLDRDALLARIGQLDADERIVVVLRFWADLQLEGIAERLDWPLGTVKSRLHRALGRMRDGFAADTSEVDR